MAQDIGRRAMLGAAFAMLAGIAVGQPAAAQGQGPGGGYGPGPGMMGGGRGMMGGAWNTGTYVDSLKTELGITAKEEPAWKDYSETVKGVGEQMQGLHQSMFEAMGTASWEERRNLMNEMFQARQDAFNTVHEAATKLMAQLDPAQQAKARTTLPGLAYGRGMMGGRYRGGGPR